MALHEKSCTFVHDIMQGIPAQPPCPSPELPEKKINPPSLREMDQPGDDPRGYVPPVPNHSQR